MLVSGSNISFVFFIYGAIQWGNFSNIGFKPSDFSFVADRNSQSFMVPIALTNDTVEIETTSNVGVPGLYAFRVDQTFIIQPGGMCNSQGSGEYNSSNFLNIVTDILAFFEESEYRVTELEMTIEVCVSIQGRSVGTSVTLLVETQFNNSAEGTF